MLGNLFRFLEVWMVYAIAPDCWRCRNCRWFWVIQFFQLGEMVYRIFHPGWDSWIAQDGPNLILEGIALLFLCCYRWAFWVMFLHFEIKTFEYSRIKDAFVIDINYDGIFWTRYWINDIIILVFIGYAVRKAILRQWREYERAPA